GAAGPAVPGGAVVPDEILISVTSDPPGAEVTVDAFPLPGVTPIAGVPVSSRDERTVRVTRDGFEPFEAAFDMTRDRDIAVVLEPLGTDVAGATAATPGSGIVLEVNEATWLEAYQSPNRNDGDRLVYTTAQPGERFEFQRPLYLHFGNAPGVDLFVDGEPVSTIGDGGAVTGQSFPAD
ncbi:MAG: RodZ domain-containing protein, partial [Trueperaceae bacterium]